MQEMNMQEVDAVSGGEMTIADAGGLVITSLGVTAMVVGSPLVAGAAITIGLGLLLRELFF